MKLSVRKIMEEINMVSKAQKNRELEAQVLELRKKECTNTEIATQLHIEQRKVTSIINTLIIKGLLNEEDRSLKKKGTLQRKQKTLELIREGKTVKEIAKTLDIALDTVYVYIKELIKNGEMTKEDLKKNSDMELENKVLELRQKEYSKIQIMKELGLGQNTVVDIIQKLADEGRLPETRLPVSEEKRTKVELRKSEVLDLLNEGYSVKEIARILRISDTTSYNDAKELIREGKISKDKILLKKQARLGELEQSIIKLLEEGNNRQQVSKILRLSYNELNPIINKLIAEHKIEYVRQPRKKSTNKAIIDEQEAFISEKEEELGILSTKWIVDDCRKRMVVYENSIKEGEISGIVRRQYATCCQKIVECGEKLTKEEVKLLAETVAYGEGKFSSQVLAFTCNEYGKWGDYISAQRLCAICTELYGESEMISRIKTMLKEARSKQVAYELIKQGKTDIEIMNASNLRQVDVIKMRKEYFSKQNVAEAER